MYEETKAGLEEAQEQAKSAGKVIVDTNRSALRSYLRAAFQLQRAGLEALEALQRGTEELTFNLVDRAEEVQTKATREAESRMRDSIERLREVREKSGESLRETTDRLQSRFREEKDDLEDVGEKGESRLRDGAEIAVKVAKVIETRIETMLSELIEMGRREMSEIEERIDALVDRLDEELEEEIHPIASYDEKSAEEIIAELRDLDLMQLRIVRAYEVRNKNRVTVLRAVDEKLAQEDEIGATNGRGKTLAARVEEKVVELVNPISNYDEKNADEVLSALDKLNPLQLAAVRAYELANKNRVTVLRALDEKATQKSEA